MVLAMTSVNFIPSSGVLDQIFHQTWLAISIFGAPKGGFKVNLIALLIILVIAVAANGITEALTSRKVGSLALAVFLTLIGAYVVATYVRMPFDFALEGVRVVAALIGAVVIAVFYTLIAGKVRTKKA
jgi:uncharacterized membrane protein YeaQ/YmgE (transglycosylase-associated protein family)